MLFVDFESFLYGLRIRYYKFRICWEGVSLTLVLLISKDHRLETVGTWRWINHLKICWSRSVSYENFKRRLRGTYTVI